MNLKEIIKYLEKKDYALASAYDTIKEDSRRIEELKTELAIRNLPLVKESLKSSDRLALRQDDEITALKAEVCSIKSDYEIVLQNDRNLIAKLRDDIEDLNSQLTEKRAIINEITALKSEVDRLRGIIRAEHDYNADLLEGNKSKFHKITVLEAELASMARDSEVFMEVVNVVRDWDDSTGRAFPTLYKIVDLLVDYIDVPEGPELPDGTKW